MADTSRTKAALLTLLADNTTGDISEQDVRDVLVSIMGGYGDIYLTGGSTAQTSIGTSYVKISGFAANGLSDETTPDHTNDRVTVTGAGVYLVNTSISFSGTGNAVITFSVHVGQAEPTQKISIVRKIGAGGDVGNANAVGILSLSASDQVELFVKSDGASDSITPAEAHLTVTRIA